MTVAAAENEAAPSDAVVLAGWDEIVITLAGTVSNAELLITLAAFVADTTTRNLSWSSNAVSNPVNDSVADVAPDTAVKSNAPDSCLSH